MHANILKDKKRLNAKFLSRLKVVIALGNFIQINNLYKLSPEFKNSHISAEKKTDAPKKKATPKNKIFPIYINKSSKKPVPKNNHAPNKKNTATKKAAPKKYLPKRIIHQLIRRRRKSNYFHPPHICSIIKEGFSSSDEISIDQR